MTEPVADATSKAVVAGRLGGIGTVARVLSVPFGVAMLIAFFTWLIPPGEHPLHLG